MVRGIYCAELEERMEQEHEIHFDKNIRTIPKFDAERYKTMSATEINKLYAERRQQKAAWWRSLPKGVAKSDPLDQAVALAKDDCELWSHQFVSRSDICSNPEPNKTWPYELLSGESKTAYYQNCNHMFTLLLDREQIERFLVEPSKWLDRVKPPNYLRILRRPSTPEGEHPDPADPTETDGLTVHLPELLSTHQKAQACVVEHFINVDRIAARHPHVWQCAPNPVWHMLRSRLDLPFHRALTATSVINTLEYLFEHMKCGVYVKIRNNRLAMFVPFCNLHYRNTWSEQFNRPDDLRAYYQAKEENQRPEEVLKDVWRWWANGNIICNQQLTRPETVKAHFWGDQHLPQMKDLIQQTCESGRQVADCEFFLNKRDHAQLKADLTEPYDFLYDSDKPMPLKRGKFTSYAPILSYYTSPTFADIPFPCGEDWMTAIGKFFPPAPDKQDSFFKDNAEKATKTFGDQSWSAKRATAIWRGSGTGGGATHEDNQRFKLHFLSDLWQSDDRYNENNGVGDGDKFLDAAVVQFSKRDKKVKGKKMGFDDLDALPFKDKVLHSKEELYVPMFKQSNHKYIIYVEGHCAANRYTFLMQLGCMILKIASTCTCSELWFFPMLVAYQDHVPVKADLSDLAEKIHWCKTHDAECEKIALRARELHARLFSKEGIMDYFQLICNEISHRFHIGQMESANAAQSNSGDNGIAASSQLPRIPDGWIECDPVGEKILDQSADGHGLLIVPCKAPLGESYDDELEASVRFGPSHLALHVQQSFQQDIGLVINLSSSSRWYTASEWSIHRARTEHIPCASRGEVPTPETVNRFIYMLQRFLAREMSERQQATAEQSKRRPKCVIVHCTHGHNRTGFMICAYLLRT
eukprot:SAG31_NODE_4321_length_3360_cov_3.636308_1_plen_866_part_10